MAAKIFNLAAACLVFILLSSVAHGKNGPASIISDSAFRQEAEQIWESVLHSLMDGRANSQPPPPLQSVLQSSSNIFTLPAVSEHLFRHAPGAASAATRLANVLSMRSICQHCDEGISAFVPSNNKRRTASKGLPAGRDLVVLKRVKGPDGEWWTGKLPAQHIDCRTLQSALKKGLSVVINRSDHRWPEIRALAEKLEERVEARVQINIYITPPNSQGFEEHFDPMDVLLLQIHGSKNWEFLESLVDLPLRGQKFKPVQSQMRGLQRVALEIEEGDAVFFRRGVMHHAHTQKSELSMHATVGIDTHDVTWLRVLHLAIAHTFVKGSEAWASSGTPDRLGTGRKETTLSPLSASFMISFAATLGFNVSNQHFQSRGRFVVQHDVCSEPDSRWLRSFVHVDVRRAAVNASFASLESGSRALLSESLSKLLDIWQLSIEHVEGEGQPVGMAIRQCNIAMAVASWQQDVFDEMLKSFAGALQQANCPHDVISRTSNELEKIQKLFTRRLAKSRSAVVVCEDDEQLFHPNFNGFARAAGTNNSLLKGLQALQHEVKTVLQQTKAGRDSVLRAIEQISRPKTEL